MNRFFLIILSFLIANTANSQITKGNWMLGGGISYASTKYNSLNYGEPHSSYNLQVEPSFGYFFVDKLSTGLKINIGVTGDKSRSQSYTDFNIGPFVRYYLLNSEKFINLLTEVNYLYGFEKGSTPEKTSKNTFKFSAGPVFYLNNVVGLEMLVSYSSYQFSGFKGSNNTIMFGLGLQVHLERDN